MQSTAPTRRDILSLGASAMGAMALYGCVTARSNGTSARNGYIDAHSHVWTSDTTRFPLGPWITPEKMEPPSFAAEQLLTLAESSGVDRVVLIQHAPYYGDDNSYLIDCAARFPGRFSIVAIVDERRSDLAQHVRRLKGQGIRGLRIGPTRYADRTLVKDPMNWLKAPDMQRLWAIATEQNLVLCPLISAEYLPTLEPMLAEFPNTTIAIDHFGHAQTPSELQSLLKLSGYARVHVKLSGFYKFADQKPPYEDLAPMIRVVAEGYGTHRLLWGSDCPYQTQNGNTYHDAVRLVESGLDFLSPAARIAILRDNASRLFFA